MKVAVLGAGYLGTAVAGELARCQCDVTLYDLSRDKLRSSLATIRKSLAELKASHAELKRMDIQQVVARITVCSELEALKDVAIVFEAIKEHKEVKKQVLCALAQVCPSAVVASNTINLNINDIASLSGSTAHNFLGIRFLSPVYLIPLVEITLGRCTCQRALDTVSRFLRHVRKSYFAFDAEQAGRQRRYKLETMEDLQKYEQYTLRAIAQGHGPPQFATLVALPTAPSSSSSSFSPSSSPSSPSNPCWESSPSSVSCLAHESASVRSTSASASATSSSSSSPDTLITMPKSSLQDDSKQCVVCMGAEKDTAIVPCGHLALCAGCADKVLQCPICRGHKQRTLRVFNA